MPYLGSFRLARLSHNLPNFCCWRFLLRKAEVPTIQTTEVSQKSSEATLNQSRSVPAVAFWLRKPIRIVGWCLSMTCVTKIDANQEQVAKWWLQCRSMESYFTNLEELTMRLSNHIPWLHHHPPPSFWDSAQWQTSTSQGHGKYGNE